MRVVIFSAIILSEAILILKQNSARDMMVHVHTASCKVPAVIARF